MPSKASLTKAFKEFDKDASGTLDATEFLAVLTRQVGYYFICWILFIYVKTKKYMIYNSNV